MRSHRTLPRCRRSGSTRDPDVMTVLIATHRTLLCGARTSSAAASVLLQSLLAGAPNPYRRPRFRVVRSGRRQRRVGWERGAARRCRRFGHLQAARLSGRWHGDKASETGWRAQTAADGGGGASGAVPRFGAHISDSRDAPLLPPALRCLHANSAAASASSDGGASSAGSPSA